MLRKIAQRENYIISVFQKQEFFSVFFAIRALIQPLLPASKNAHPEVFSIYEKV